VLEVVYNASNNELVRTNTLVKGAIISIDASPFRAWYGHHFGVALGKKKKGEETKAPRKRSANEVKKLAERNKTRVLDPNIEQQFLTGRLLLEPPTPPPKASPITKALNKLQGRVAEKIMKNHVDQSTTECAGMADYDASTDAELVGKIKAMFEEFRKAPPAKEPDENIIRPLYVELSVVNKAYQTWLKEPKKTPCSAQQKEVIFADPPLCMRIAPGPGRIPRLVNARRLNKRATCIYTTVRCLDKDFFKMTADDITKEVDKQYADSNGAFWVQKALFGPREAVEKAWQDWNDKKLNGKKGIMSGKNICGKPEGEVRAHEGSRYAQFAQSEACISPGGGADETAMYGMDSDCKTVIVECV